MEAVSADSNFPTLQERCLVRLIINLESYSPEDLSLLPKHLRLALMKYVSPLHLCWLEQTPVAEGIESEILWSTLNDIPYHRRSWSIVFPKGCDFIVPLKQVFLTQLYPQILNHFDKVRVVRRTEITLFGVFKERLTPGMFSCLCNEFKTRRRTFGDEYDCFLTAVHDRWDYLTIIKTLSKYRVYPRVIRLPVTPSLKEEAVKKLVMEILSAPKVRGLSLMNTFTDKDHLASVTSIMDTLMNNPEHCLEILHLQFITGNGLQSIASHFLAPNGYSGLTQIDLSIPNVYGDNTGYAPLLVAMLENQQQLEELLLEGHWHYSVDGVDLIPTLASLFKRPSFKRLHLQSSKDIAQSNMHLLIESLLKSEVDHRQEIRFNGMCIYDDITPPEVLAVEEDTPRDGPMDFVTSGQYILRMLNRAMRDRRMKKFGLDKSPDYDSLDQRPMMHREDRRKVFKKAEPKNPKPPSKKKPPKKKKEGAMKRSFRYLFGAGLDSDESSTDSEAEDNKDDVTDKTDAAQPDNASESDIPKIENINLKETADGASSSKSAAQMSTPTTVASVVKEDQEKEMDVDPAGTQSMPVGSTSSTDRDSTGMSEEVSKKSRVDQPEAIGEKSVDGGEEKQAQESDAMQCEAVPSSSKGTEDDTPMEGTEEKEKKPHPFPDWKMPILDIERKHLEAYGDYKLLFFDKVHFTRSFFTWISGIPYLNVDTLEFESCTMVGEREIQEFFYTHEDFHARRFYASFNIYS